VPSPPPLSVSRIALVKPDKASAVTDLILATAQRGGMTERITEHRLKQMIESVNEGATQAKTTKITVSRSPQPHPIPYTSVTPAPLRYPLLTRPHLAVQFQRKKYGAEEEDEEYDL
jgi:hypothetical protein